MDSMAPHVIHIPGGGREETHGFIRVQSYITMWSECSVRFQWSGGRMNCRLVPVSYIC